MKTVRREVEEILKKYDDARSDIVAVLEEVQKTFGCLPEDALSEVADGTELALVRVMDVVEHHDGFVLGKDLKKPIEICTCPNCKLNGGGEILKGLRDVLLTKSCCNGIGTRYCISTFNATDSPCVRPPTVVVDGKKYQDMTLSRLIDMLEASVAEPAECKRRDRPRAASL